MDTMRAIVDSAVRARAEEVKKTALSAVGLDELPSGVSFDWEKAARRVILIGAAGIGEVISALRKRLEE